MDIGQRIAQKRKELGLSQEALGERLGVSRQSIYKWESDTALPEVEKLIALAKLFGVSIGWLLGVEEAAVSSDSGELTPAQLAMVQEIVDRYVAAMPQPKPRRRWPIVLAAVVLFFSIFNLFEELDMLQMRQDSILNDISRVESSVDRQINGISGRLEEILKAQNALTADYGTELAALDLAANTAGFSLYAVPKTYVEGMTVEFLAENGQTSSRCTAQSGQGGSAQRFSADLSIPLTDTVALSAIFITPDGQRQTQLLDVYEGLYSASLPTVELNSNFMWMDAPEGIVTLGADSHERYVWDHAPAVPTQVLTPGSIGQVLQKPVEIREIRVGLFKNQQLLAWAEPCPKPDSFSGFEDQDFYRLPEISVPMTAEDILQVAAVVEDVYGRRTIAPDRPFILDTEDMELTTPSYSEMDCDLSHWTFS